MNSDINSYILDFLENNLDSKYQEFTAKLIPNIDHNSILGVRLPVLRKFCKTLTKRGDIKRFLTNLPHKYHEENLIHAILLSSLKDYDEAINELELFLPHVTNWAVCDIIMPKILCKNIEETKCHADIWISSGESYKIRFGIDTYMKFRLGEYFTTEDLRIIANIKNDNYYVNMMRAWYFATALAFQYDETVKLIESKTLDKFTHNKSIQKAIESFRVTNEHKVYLKTLRI